MKRKGVWLGLLVVLLLWPASVALANDPGLHFDGGQIFIDEDVSLEPGETFDGDLGIFDGNLTVPQGSVVNGDVFVTNGDADIAGRVRGDLAVISGDLYLADTSWAEGDVFVMSGDQDVSGRVKGNLSVMFGDVELRSSAVVEGDLMVLSGSLERETGAQVLGEAMPEIPFPPIPLIREKLGQPEIPERPEIARSPEVPRQVPTLPPVQRQLPRETLGQRIGSFVGRTIMAGFLSLLFIAVGVLLVMLWPRPTHQVADCIAAMPVQSLVMGLLSFLIAAILEALAMVLMIIIILVAAVLIGTVILIPIGLLLILLSVLVLLPVPLVLAGAMVLGWVALAELVGQKAVKVLKAGYVKPLGATFVGLLITVPLAAILWVIKPVCCAWPFIILLTSMGLGAVIQTRFGRQSCRQSKSPADLDLLPAEAMDEEAGQPDEPVTRSP